MLKDNLIYLLALESILSALYSGISTVAMKLFTDSLSEQEDLYNKSLGIVLSIIIFLVSVFYNVITLNHVLSLYPSLTAVPCY